VKSQTIHEGYEYYAAGGIEIEDILHAKVPKEWKGMAAVYLARCLRYACRMGFKNPDPLEDAKKLEQHAKWLREQLESQPRGPLPVDEDALRSTEGPWPLDRGIHRREQPYIEDS
jgi:hypothetical protein